MTPRPSRILAFIYDFDGTLIDGDSLDDFLTEKLAGNRSAKKFWNQSNKFAKKNKFDRISAFMFRLCQDKKIMLDMKKLSEIGKKIKMRDGLEPKGRDPGWFGFVNQLARKQGIITEHYVITSGIAEIVEACPISSELKKVFGSRLHFTGDPERPVWPSQMVNHTTKTQYLFRINKDVHDISDDDKVNRYMDPNDRPIPFEQMVFVGDGSTDVPCFSLIKQQGGWTIAMRKGKRSTPKHVKQLETLVIDKRVDVICIKPTFDDESIMREQAKRIIKELAEKLNN